MMKLHWIAIPTLAAVVAIGTLTSAVHADPPDQRYYQGRFEDHYDGKGFFDDFGRKRHDRSVQLGPRPFFLIDALEDGRLKSRLRQCKHGPFYQTDFSIGHRGAPLQFPEHTKESYEAAARMGAGILECDVSFTNDGHLVCRHAQCDLHTTTNIVATPLNENCSIPWDADNPNPSTVKCCTSDLTLAEFKSLEGKMDARNPNATTAQEYLGGTADWRTTLYTSRGTVLSHAESIRLFRKLGAKFTPELKSPDRSARVQVEDVFGSQAAYAQKLIDDYEDAGIQPAHVWAQSFDLNDVLYWIRQAPAFGRQAVYLDDIDPTDGNPDNDLPPTLDELRALKAQGVRIVAPPMWALLSVDDRGEVIPSEYAMNAGAAGLDIITWTFERSDLRNGSAQAGWYYRFDDNPAARAIRTDGDMYKALDVLARKVRILGIFSDWPATVTYYANCMGLR